MERLTNALLLLVVVLLAAWAVTAAFSDAGVAQTEAAEAERRALLASAEADRAWEAYTARSDSLGRVLDSLEAARNAARTASARIRVRVDTLRALVPVAGAVPRELHDSIVAGLDRLVLAEAGRADAAEAETTLWRERWAVADSGWAQERAANTLLRRAVEEWRDAASPPWWRRLQRNAGVAAGTAVVAVLAWEAVR